MIATAQFWLEGLFWISAALIAANLAYLALCMAAVWASKPPAASRFAVPPCVTLLKPLCGLEDGLELGLESFLGQQIEGQLRVVFGVAQDTDPALVLARQVAARYPQVDVRFVIDSTVHGPNPKVSNLINMARHAPPEGFGQEPGNVVMLSDSDILIGPGVLQRALDGLAVDGVGAVTALYRARPGIAGDRWRTFAAWFLDYWFLPMAVLHARLAPLSVTYGPLTAVRADVLERAGGLAALADHLSDDAELGRLVREQGMAVAFTPDIAETLVNDAHLAELFDHELRWSRTVRGLDPLGFFASVVSHPGPLALLVLVFPGWLALALILAPLVLRYGLVRLIEQRFGRAAGMARPGLAGLWLRDLYCFAVWAAACVVSRVGWRGAKLDIAHKGILAGDGGQPR